MGLRGCWIVSSSQRHKRSSIFHAEVQGEEYLLGLCSPKMALGLGAGSFGGLSWLGNAGLWGRIIASQEAPAGGSLGLKLPLGACRNRFKSSSFMPFVDLNGQSFNILVANFTILTIL